VRGHIIVHGDDALAMRIVEELDSADASVVIAASAVDLKSAGVAQASAVICVDDDDATNLEIALLAREANPDVRVVARLANSVLREAVAAGNGPGAILDVADLAAPAVVDACLARTTHTFEAAGTRFVVTGTEAPRYASLREIYGDLAPVAVIHGDNSPNPGAVVACPGRDEQVRVGDWTAMIGTADELAARGIKIPRQQTGTKVRRPPIRRALDNIRSFRDNINPMFFRSVAAALTLLIVSTLVLRYSYHKPGMSFVDALYFSTETIATVGYGDFSFQDQPTWLRLFGIVLMFAGVTTTAILVAFIADVLLSRRFAYSSGRRKAQHLRNHIVVVGLGSFGIRVVTDLYAAGYDVAVIERDDNNRFLSTTADLEIPVIFGDSTLRQTLESARVEVARAVAILTQDDMANIETGIVLREMFGPRTMPEVVRPDVPIVMRLYDRELGAAAAQRFDFDHVRSTVELATPWFIGAAMGLQVITTFSVGQSSFMVGAVKVEPKSELDGIRMFEMSTQTRVFAITQGDKPAQLHPRRDTRLTAGDTAYLVGPYRELLATLRKGQRAQQPGDGPVSAAKTG
jgi:Trk K+ transport system NAD-binding subunit/multidrug transporter EmrE-like cation transporter